MGTSLLTRSTGFLALFVCAMVSACSRDEIERLIDTIGNRPGGSVGDGGTATGVGGSSAGVGGNAAGVGGSSAGVGGSAAGVGGSIEGVGGSAEGVGGSAEGVGGSAAGVGGSIAGVGGSATGVGGSAAGVGGSAGNCATDAATITTNPDNQATGIDPAASIQATFSRAMASSTLNGDTFTVTRNGVGIAGTVTYTADTRVATFRPQRSLALLGRYTATITTGATDANGCPLAASRSWSFTVREGRWGTTELVENNPGDAAGPQIAVDGSGNATVVWFQRNSDRDDIWANRFVSCCTWGTPTLIETDDTGFLQFPQVAVDPSGTATAVWHGPQMGTTALSIGDNRFVPGAGWGTAGLVGNPADALGSDAQITVDPSGIATVVWTQFEGVNHNTRANRFVPGVGWGTSVTLGTDAGGLTQYAPRVASDSAGNVTAVWTQNAKTTQTLWFSRFVTGSGWTIASLIPGGSPNGADEPALAVDGAGNVTVLWAQIDPVFGHVWANRFVPGTGWETATQLDASTEAFSTSVAVDSAGNATAVWIQGTPQAYSVWSARFVPGSGWGAGTRVQAAEGYPSYALVTVDTAGNALAVWQQTGAIVDSIWVNRFIPASGWGTATLLESDDTGYAVTPRIAFDPSGNALAVWSQSNGTNSKIWARSFR